MAEMNNEYNPDLITLSDDDGKEYTFEVLDAIETAKPGDRITLTVLDEKGKTRTVTAELLADKGSSSYSTVISDDKDNKDDKEDNYTEEFDFPFGE